MLLRLSPKNTQWLPIQTIGEETIDPKIETYEEKCSYDKE
jgi:hypothetical protein